MVSALDSEAVLFSIPDGSFKRFENGIVKLSAEETKWILLAVRTRPTFLETLISKYDFRNGALARDIVLCSWARHLLWAVPLSTQVYQWVLANLLNAGGNLAMD